MYNQGNGQRAASQHQEGQSENVRVNRIIHKNLSKQRMEERSLSERQIDHGEIQIKRKGNGLNELKPDDFNQTERKNNMGTSKNKLSHSGTQTLKSQCSQCSAQSQEIDHLNA